MRCDDPRTGEVLHVDDNFFAGEESIPSDEVLLSRSFRACVVALEVYIGIA